MKERKKYFSIFDLESRICIHGYLKCFGGHDFHEHIHEYQERICNLLCHKISKSWLFGIERLLGMQSMNAILLNELEQLIPHSQLIILKQSKVNLTALMQHCR